ncbi:MAG: SufS family cysteine desulfurase [Treponema sp.]|nr:SufS family cysteine desulfurase [Treponema sp.]
MKNFYRDDFPFFSSKKNEGIVYFDNAATTQRPACVMEAMKQFYCENNANPLRGLYELSVRATESYASSRSTVAKFINAKTTDEIIFTRNTTESLNLIAYSYALSHLKTGDEIVVSAMEHHSNILPWQMASEKTGAHLTYLEPDLSTYEISRAELLSKITEKTKIVAITHVSNVLGVTNDIPFIAELAHKVGAVLVVDGAQAAPHIAVDVQKLGADFYAFSGHKLCGPTGCGVLYGKRELLEEMPPFLRGGEMIEYVTREKATWAPLPEKFEAGTVNAGGAVGLASAISYIQSIGFEKIQEHDNLLSTMLIDGMKNIPHVHIVGSPDATKHCGIVTFTIDGVHPHDIASVLDSEEIAIRAGHHCAQVLGSYLSLPSTARASLYFYNTESEVSKFLETLQKVRSWMGHKD